MGHRRRCAARCLRAGQVPRRHTADDRYPPVGRRPGADQASRPSHEGSARPGRHSKSGRRLAVVDEYTRQCLAIKGARHIRAPDVLQCLTDMFVTHGVPARLRADHGPEFTNRAVRTWLGRVGARPLFSSSGALGRTARLRASTASCGTSCLIGRSSIASGGPRC